MKRRLFNILTRLSLLMLGLSVFLWIWSQNHLVARCTLRWSEQGNEIKYVMTDEGIGPWGFFSGIIDRGYHFDDYIARAAKNQDRVRNEFLKYSPSNTDKSFWCDAIPDFTPLMNLTSSSEGHSEGLRLYRYSSLVGWFSVLPALWLFVCGRKWLDYRKRKLEGCCKQCGYDLRATPGRCPECGAVAAGK